jgi:hypothetical protein
MMGGGFLLLAAALVSRVVDVGDQADEDDVIEADEHERFTVQESAQPVPSTALLDEERHRDS